MKTYCVAFACLRLQIDLVDQEFLLQAGGEAGQVVATTSIAVVDPFQLQLVCSAPAGTCSLIIADPQVIDLEIVFWREMY